MSCWLEVYLVVTTTLLIVLAWLQSHPWAWEHTLRGWALRLLVLVMLTVRIGEILSQSVEVVLGRIEADAASGLATLVIYVLQTVAIFAIWSEYAVYAWGYGQAFKEFGSRTTGWLEYAYLAWANLVTFGSAYSPQSPWAKVVVVCSGLAFILLFSVLLAFVMEQIRKSEVDTPPLGGS
jgi:hypothetical protein